MDDQTNTILDFQLVQVSEVANSSRMEKAGLERSLEKLENSGLQIGVLATDRHPQIAFMRKNYQNVNHQFDVWHLAKNVSKKLREKAKTKKCPALMPWLKSISNHLWWSAATYNGDPDILKEK